MRRLFGFAVVAASLVYIVPDMATAQTAAEARRNAMRHLANAYVVAARCKALEVDAATAAMIAVGNGIDLRDEPTKREMLGIGATIAGEIRPMSDEVVCAGGALLYGPNGANVPNLLRLK